MTSPTRITTPFTWESTAAQVVEGIDLTGRRAVVTGGASGIGIETARALAGAGAEVTLAVRDTAAGERTARDIAATTGSEFGEGRTNTVTRLPLMVRLQTPRFLVAGDQATISASLDNNTSAPLTVTPTLAVEGVELLGWYHSGILQTGPPAAVEVPAGGGARVDWAVRAPKPGPAKFTVTARSPGLADAMQRELTVA